MMRSASAELLGVEVQAAEVRGGVALVEPAAQGVLEGLGLLVDLLEHVVLVSAEVDVRRGSTSMSCDRGVDRLRVAVLQARHVGAVSTHIC